MIVDDDDVMVLGKVLKWYVKDVKDVKVVVKVERVKEFEVIVVVVDDYYYYYVDDDEHVLEIAAVFVFEMSS